MERVIATHHLEGHRLDVIEAVDDEDVTVRLLLDGALLSPDTHPDRVPTPDEIAALFEAQLAAQDTAGSSQVVTSGGLLPGEVIALLEALDDEYKAHTTYAQVLIDFGHVLPFANIIDAEARHIEALTRLMQRYEVPVPSNPWIGKVPRFASVAEACAASVEAEIDNGVLYDRLMAAIVRPDIRDVLRRLRDASQERHLPAFQRCASRTGAAGDHHGAAGHRRRRHRHRGA